MFGSMLGNYFGQKAQKSQNRLTGLGLQYSLNRAKRNKVVTDDEAHLGIRRGEEDFSSRGLEESSIRNQGMARINERAQFARQGATEDVDYASKAIGAFRKSVKNQRRQYYMNQAMTLLQNALAVYSMFPGGAGVAPAGAMQGAQMGSAAGVVPPSPFMGMEVGG